jgi:ribosomal-protein-alanine N-acetyltransferase
MRRRAMMAEKAAVREMKETDLAQVMEIERASFPTPWTETMFERQLLLGDAAINLVSVAGGRIVGYAVSWIAYDEVHILSIAVIPAERRKGYAEELLVELIRGGRDRGVVRVILEVRTGNAPARRFYEKQGFSVIGIRKRYYVDTGEDAVVMELCIED